MTTPTIAPNILVALAAGLIPLVLGFLWYNPKTFGNAWMKAADMTEDKMKGANMAVIFGLTYVFSVLAALGLHFMVIHQFGAQSLFVTQPGFEDPASEVAKAWTEIYNKYGQNHRNFGHGAIHGAFGAIGAVLPPIAVNALFERKGFKYIAINFGFWLVSFMLMGGVVCQFA